MKLTVLLNHSCFIAHQFLIAIDVFSFNFRQIVLLLIGAAIAAVNCKSFHGDKSEFLFCNFDLI